MSERTYAQSLQDDEDHRLALCGLSFDARVEQELEDFEVRAYDFVFASTPLRPRTQAGDPDVTRNGGGFGVLAPSPPSLQTFASGRRDPAPPDAKRPQGVGGGPVRTEVTRALGPPPLSKT